MDFLRVHLIPSSTPLVRVISSVGPRIDPLGTPLVTDSQFEKEIFPPPPGCSPSHQAVPHPLHGSLYTMTLKCLKKEAVGNGIKSLREIQVNNRNHLPHISWAGYLVIEYDMAWKVPFLLGESLLTFPRQVLHSNLLFFFYSIHFIKVFLTHYTYYLNIFDSS